MDDDGCNICENYWNDQIMQRLLSILRQSQSACTENECFPVSRLPGPQAGQPSTDVFFMTMILGMMALLYAFRPKSLRQSSFDDVKPRDDAPGSNGDPPAPPPAAN